MSIITILFLLISYSTTYDPYNPNIRIGALHLNSFGENTTKDDIAMQIIVNLIQYDITLVQGYDESQKASLNILFDLLNLKTSDEYLYEISEFHSGRYIYFFRKKFVSVIHTLQNKKTEWFKTPPISIQFRLEKPNFSPKDVIITGFRASTTQTVSELNHLKDVYDEILMDEKFTSKNVIFMGNFLADAPYVTKSDWSKIRIRNEKEFDWLIKDGMDTTLEGIQKTYDRIIVSKNMNNLKSNINKEINVKKEILSKIIKNYPIELNIPLEHSSSDFTWTLYLIIIVIIGVNIYVLIMGILFHKLRKRWNETKQEMYDRLQNEEHSVWMKHSEKNFLVNHIW